MNGLHGPLSGVRVLDLTRLLPGPMCTLHLADMGADVIKIEDPRCGDYAREMGDFYELINRNKRSVVLDLKTQVGKDNFFALAKTAHVILEGFRPGVANRLGIDYDPVKAVNPKIVYCSITGYGQTGPYRHKAVHDINCLAYTGILDQMGREGKAPALSNIQMADVLGGAMGAVMGILAVLFETTRTGVGRYVDVSMADCVLSHHVMPLMAFNQGGCSPGRGRDLLNGGLPWYNIYRTADDRYVALGALEKKFWKNFCKAIDQEQWQEQPQDQTQRDRIQSELRRMFLQQSLDAWVEKFKPVDCCFSPVLSLEQAMQDPHLSSRAVFRKVDGRVEYTFPIRFHPTQEQARSPAPKLGEHTDEVLNELISGADDNHCH